MPLPERNHPAHPSPIQSGDRSTILFVTVCVKGRRSLLAREDIHSLLRDAWMTADRWRIGCYMIMPDHLHFFAAPRTFPPSPLKSWMRYWQNLATRGWPRVGEKPIWQADFWDTQLRQSEYYSVKWNYVRENPVRGGLAGSASDWPFQGEMEVLDWHD